VKKMASLAMMSGGSCTAALLLLLLTTSAAEGLVLLVLVLRLLQPLLFMLQLEVMLHSCRRASCNSCWTAKGLTPPEIANNNSQEAMPNTTHKQGGSMCDKQGKGGRVALQQEASAGH
jgi:hypothetical protein